MFENVSTNQNVDPGSFQDTITNDIERWGFGLEVEHET